MNLLHYRPWQGTLRGPVWSIWPIARVGLVSLFQRRLFWLLYISGLLLFLMFFFGSYLLSWMESQVPAAPIKIGNFQAQPEQMIRFLRQGLQVLNGSRETFATFFTMQGTTVMIVLALAGSVLVGNDYTFRSLPFYLSKPIGRWHYLAGKCLAAAILVMLLTTGPALVLYAQHALDDWGYLTDPDFFQGKSVSSWRLLAGIVGYGILLAGFLSLLLVTVSSAVRRTLPLVMAWTSLFFFLRLLSGLLVDGLQYNPNWRLLDLWNDLAILGRGLLGYESDKLGLPGPQPSSLATALTLGGVTLACLIYLNLRTRAVAIVR